MPRFICSLSECGLPFYRRNDKNKKHYLKYCSRDCYRLARRDFAGVAYPRIWYNGRREYLHRVLYEQGSGETLTNIDIVHHKDSNPFNRAFDNLEKLTSSEHQRKHYAEKTGMYARLKDTEKDFEVIDGNVIKW